MFASGTSMATPMVSGAAALVLSVCKTLDTAALRADLLSTVTELGSLVGLVETAGRLNVDRAVRACAPPQPPSAPTGLAAVPGNAKVALTWTAAAGATRYNVKVATSTKGPWTTVGSSEGNSYIATGLQNGTLYYFVVSSVNDGGESAASSYVSAKPSAPAGPLGLTVTAGEWSASLAWTASTGATGYNIKVASASTGPWTTVATTTSTAFTVPHLTGNKLYYFVVSFTYADGESANSSSVSARPTAPAGPTGLTATALNAKVSLAWTPSARASAYNIKRATSTSGPWTLVGTSIDPTFTATNLTNGVVYYFVVSFLADVDESLNSSYVSAKPAAPAGPTSVAATPGQWTAALTWAAASAASSYNVKISNSTSGPWKTVGTTTSTAFTVTQLSGNVLYYFVVSYTYADGESSNSLYVSAKPTAPAGPIGLKAAGGNASATLTWTSSAGATSYAVKRATSATGPWTTVETTASTTSTVTGLTNGTLYYFVVSVVTPDGESLNSSYVSAKPLAPPLAPTGLKAGPQTGQMYLTWSAATGATGYNVYRSNTSGGPYDKVGTTTSRAYYDKLLLSGVSYCYVIKAYNANGTEGPSSNESCGIVQ
jgi:fibronectin type 3 domain-containing protein